MPSVVVDTHAAIWYFTDPGRLSIAALDAIEERPEPAPLRRDGLLPNRKNLTRKAI